jgi:hypothetical protein
MQVNPVSKNTDSPLFDETLSIQAMINSIHTIAILLFQEQSRLNREYARDSKLQLKEMAKEIQQLYNTPGQMSGQALGFALSMFAAFSGISGNQAVSTGVSAMANAVGGASQFANNAVEAERGYAQFMLEQEKRKHDQESQVGKQHADEARSHLRSFEEAAKSEHDTKSGIMR